MSAVAAHYPPADRRYADLAATYADPTAYFSYAPASLATVPAAPAVDAAYVPAAAPSYLSWDAHEPSAYPTSSSSFHSAAPAATGPSSVTASFSYAAPPDYAVSSSHRGSFPTHPSRAGIPSHHAHPTGHSSSSPTTSSNGRRQSYSSGARSYSSLAAAAAGNAGNTGSSSTPRLQNASWDSAELYTIEPSDPVAHASAHHAYSRSSVSSPPTTSASPPIKEEDAEGEFIIEVSVPAEPVLSAMPEVPLRATHAPPKMRKMMYSFRLESFAMHDGIRSAATQPGPGGIEVGPLKEKPLEFEWQAQLDVPLIPEEDGAFPYVSASSKSQCHGHAQRAAATPSLADRWRGQACLNGSRRERAEDSTAGSASPALSLDYPHTQLDDTWEGSSGYGSIADNGSGSATASTSSPTFAPILTPAQSLGWSLRYQSGEVQVDSSSYHRQPQAVAQPSLSRVSQTQGRYLLGGSSTAKSYPAQQQPQYAYDTSGGYSTRSGGTASRYAEVYAAPSSSSAGWYRS